MFLLLVQVGVLRKRLCGREEELAVQQAMLRTALTRQV